MVVDVGERDGVDQTHRERKKEKKKEREEERKKDVIVEYAALLRHKHWTEITWPAEAQVFLVTTVVCFYTDAGNNYLLWHYNQSMEM